MLAFQEAKNSNLVQWFSCLSFGNVTGRQFVRREKLLCSCAMAKCAYLTVHSYMESGNCESGAALLQQKPHLFLHLSWDDSVQHVEGVLGIALRPVIGSSQSCTCVRVCAHARVFN